MAGKNPDFDAKEFRRQIRSVFTMAASPVSDEQVSFHFPAVQTTVGSVDSEGVPFDPDVAMTLREPPAVRVPCAVEYLDRESQVTNFGFIAPTRVKITLLDEDYAKVKGASYVTIAGDKYDFRRTEPPVGLFDAGIKVMHFVAENET